MKEEKFSQWREKVLKDEYKAIYPMRFGMRQEEVIAEFGSPNNVSIEKKPKSLRLTQFNLHYPGYRM